MVSRNLHTAVVFAAAFARRALLLDKARQQDVVETPIGPTTRKARVCRHDVLAA